MRPLTGSVSVGLLASRSRRQSGGKMKTNFRTSTHKPKARKGSALNVYGLGRARVMHNASR
jgi:hypothetical protein